MFSAAEDATTTGTAECFVCREGNNIGVRNGIGMHPTGDKPGDMRSIEHQQRANFIGDLADGCRVDNARISSGASDDHLWALTQCDFAHLIHINTFIGRRYAIGHEVVKASRDIHW